MSKLSTNSHHAHTKHTTVLTRTIPFEKDILQELKLCATNENREQIETRIFDTCQFDILVIAKWNARANH